MKRLSKLFALVLVVVMVCALFAGCNKTPTTTTTTKNTTTTTTKGDEPPVKEAYDYNADGNYTQLSAMTVAPTNWNPHTYKTSTDGDAFSYISNSLYEYAYNEAGDGFELVPVMAAADPVDVTSEYVGEKWGITAEDSNRVFRIALNPDACWQDGTPINADTYIYSMKALLDPQMQNYRASDYYQGSLAIHNAKGYVYSGQINYEPAYNLETGEPVAPEGETLYLDLSNIDAFGGLFGGTNAVDLYDGGYAGYFKVGDDFDFVAKYRDAVGANRIEATDEVISDIKKLMTEGPLAAYWGWADEKIGGFLVYASVYPEVPFEDVGIKKIDDYTIDLILDKELIGFYQKYVLGTTWLVKEDVYEACKTQDATGAWSSTYNTNAENTVSFGPYKLTSFILDQQLVWERNENWFGYKPEYSDVYGKFTRGIDGTEQIQYMTDKVVWTMAADISTREEMFLKGQLDTLGLNAELLAKYNSSDVLYFTPGAATYYGIICSDYENLLGSENVLNGSDADTDPDKTATPYKYNKTILTIKEFRQALCYAIDRTALCAALYPAGTAATSLFSNLIQADPANGVALNNLPEIRAAICEFWGVTYGEGGEFATLDEAYNAISGYDIDLARELVDIAVDKAIEQGLMTSDSIVRLVYGASTASDTETKWYNTFNNMFIELFKGTKLEGKFQYDTDFTLGNEFGDKIQAGQVDTAWGFGWRGGELDPYDLFQVYVDGHANDDPYQYDKWVDRSKINVTISLDIDGKGAKDYTYSVYDWWQIINGSDANDEGLPNWAFGKMQDSIRATVLAALEKSVLLDYTSIPLMNQGSVQLKSYKVNYGKEDYVFGMGYGGLRYITYNYTDEDWTSYCNSQPNGILAY